MTRTQTTASALGEEEDFSHTESGQIPGSPTY